MVNENCLEGIRCPDCGNEKAFYIQSTAVMYVTDDGAECRSDIEWDDHSHTHCPQCERSGALADFKAKPPAARARQYTVGSSHGELTIDAGGQVIDHHLDNDDADGGGHLARITRFDIAEWRRHWQNPTVSHIDILDLGYWYTDPQVQEIAFAPPDLKSRSEIAENLLERRAAAEAGGGTACAETPKNVGHDRNRAPPRGPH
jgi:hypothetical protein